MEEMTLVRPPVDPRKTWEKWILAIICFGMGAYLILTSVRLADDFRNRSARAVELTATITHVEKVYRGDFTDYDVYVAYEYNGKQYSIRYLSTHNDAFDRIGERVSIVVDSEEPDVQIDDMVDGYFFAFFFGMPIFAAGFWCLSLNGHKTYTEEYGKTEKAMKADIIMADRRRVLWLPLLIYSVGNIAWGICIRDLDGIFAGVIVLGVMVMPFWIILLVRYITRQAHVRDNI